MTSSVLQIFLIFCFLVFSQMAVAQQDESASSETEKKTESKEEKKAEEEENIRTGVIANTGSFGLGPQSITTDTSGASPGDEASVIQANVSRLGGEKCNVTVSNASKENTYSVGYRVIARNNRGSKVSSKYFSGRLRAGEKQMREVNCDRDHRMSVELVKANKR